MKYIFIDIDNTILDFDAYVKQTMKAGFEKFGITAYEPWMYEVFTTENNKLWQQIERGEITFEGLKKVRWNTIFGKLGIDFDGPTFEVYFRQALYDCAIPVEGAYELLDALKKDYVLCTASNGPFEQQMHRLELANMKDYFTYHFISQQIGVAKPSKAFFDYAFAYIEEKTGEKIAPSDCLIIGDSMTSDMAGGISYGMKTCLFEKNKTNHPDKERVDYICNDLRDVKTVLKSLINGVKS